MAETGSLTGQQLLALVGRMERLVNQLIKEIRRSGEDNLSVQYYLDEFKNFQIQLTTSQPLQEIFRPQLMQVLGDALMEHTRDSRGSTEFQKQLSDEPLKPAIRRQLVLIQTQQTRCQEICTLIEVVESELAAVGTDEAGSSVDFEDARHKLLEVYLAAEECLNDISKSLEEIVSILENLMERSRSPCISFEKSIISPESHRRSALTSILETMNHSDKAKAKSDPSNTREKDSPNRMQRKLVAKFQLIDKPVPLEIKPQLQRLPMCGSSCLLF